MSDPAARLRARIAERGPIPFAELMEEALYGEGGYYAGGGRPIGRSGDFVTGASYSPLFGRATARLLARLDGALGRPAAMLEAGFGGGEHLRAVRRAGGGERRLWGWDRARPAPAGEESGAEGFARLGGLEELPAGGVEGLVFSYELFDALPVHRLIGRREGGPGELLVGLGEEGGFVWVEGELSDPALAGLLPPGRGLEPGQIADLSPGWGPLYRRLAGRLGRGLMVTCDYGYEARRLLDPRVRRHGTLACYHRQRVHRDPFRRLGGQDLTAHVDFDRLRRAGEEAGLATVAFTRQALWLTACGLFEELAGAGLEAREQARTLLDGAGMGEEIRVLVQARGVDPAALLDLSLLGGGTGDG